jgi:hypothetical protein
MMNMGNIADTIAESLPTREDVIKAIGLANRQQSTLGDMASSLTIFGAGLLVGAGLALLFAPESGEKLRRDLTDRFNRLREDAPRNAKSTARRAGVSSA